MQCLSGSRKFQWGQPFGACYDGPALPRNHCERLVWQITLGSNVTAFAKPAENALGIPGIC